MPPRKTEKNTKPEKNTKATAKAPKESKTPKAKAPKESKTSKAKASKAPSVVKVPRAKRLNAAFPSAQYPEILQGLWVDIPSAEMAERLSEQQGPLTEACQKLADQLATLALDAPERPRVQARLDCLETYVRETEYIVAHLPQNAIFRFKPAEVARIFFPHEHGELGADLDADAPTDAPPSAGTPGDDPPTTH